MKKYLNLTILDWIIELFALIAMLYMCRPLLFLKELGNSLIPIHYNIRGQVDGWGGKNYLWLLLFITLFLYILLSIVGKYFYKSINYPIEITPENEAVAYKYGSRTLRYLKFFIVATLAYIGNTSISITMGDEMGLNPYIMIALFCGVLGTVVLFVIKMFRLN